MEMKLDRRYPLAVEPQRAWALLRDVRAVAGCMPGAAITEQVDDTHFKGSVKVKLGPANAAFGGDLEVLGLDESAMRLQMLGKGADRAGSSASMNLTAQVEPGDSAASAVLVGQATVTVSGKFVQFGGRMMEQVADLLLGQFADNFRAAAAALPGPALAPVPSGAGAAQAGEGGAAAAPAAGSTTRAGEINALAIAWRLFRNWLARLLGRRSQGG